MTVTTGEVIGRVRRVASRPTARVAVGVVVLAALAVGGYLILPTIEAAGAALVGADARWVVLAVACEAGSIVAFSLLHHRLLRAAAVRVRFRAVVLVTLAANALHLTLPGGAALSTAYTFRKRRAWGASGPITTWTMVAGGVAASLALAGIAVGSALVVNGRATTLGPQLLQLAGVVALGALIVVVSRRPGLITAAGAAGLRLVNRIRRRPRETGVPELVAQIEGLALIELDGRGRVVVGLSALSNWLLDIACLAACCVAVGANGMTLSLVLVAYAAATAASSIAFLPGGLGLVDGALLAALVAGGVPSHPALAAVLLYRLVSFVGVAASGWLAWLWVHTRGGVDEQPLDDRDADDRDADEVHTLPFPSVRTRGDTVGPR
ncbi:lysylphosphatidylglycerol synthase transmembrane domain-containing protein [Actinomycetospora termitidis]|uniref:Lysylphosphatidylglycerol synthase transmembrane domain-containing protein n=1 Tax=Actinomycetospora termitidis TaxID=3053470 RepID=A0ABT7M4J5_9PSEU|nr:lysylphosphatidylglycerol synthase transmembrane domain-containing protein [Actinomycetospora sp. Odt1-22]MDL5154378.1 lysylphosphatidylglycerol synthase transmembrane domain-containing protein [Actinomycetospora sp. Odt1-22]